MQIIVSLVSYKLVFPQKQFIISTPSIKHQNVPNRRNNRLNTPLLLIKLIKLDIPNPFNDNILPITGHIFGPGTSS